MVDQNLPEASVPQRLDDAGNWLGVVQADLTTALGELTGDTSMSVVVDLTNAIWNVRTAAALLEKATTTLEAATAEVTR